MKLQFVKILACIVLFATCCISCKANENSSQASEPKVKTTKKATNNKAGRPTSKPETNNNTQLQVVVLIDVNGKVTFPMGWVIDAPVENKPTYYCCGDNSHCW